MGGPHDGQTAALNHPGEHRVLWLPRLPGHLTLYADAGGEKKPYYEYAGNGRYVHGGWS